MKPRLLWLLKFKLRLIWLNDSTKLVFTTILTHSLTMLFFSLKRHSGHENDCDTFEFGILFLHLSCNLCKHGAHTAWSHGRMTTIDDSLISFHGTRHDGQLSISYLSLYSFDSIDALRTISNFLFESKVFSSVTELSCKLDGVSMFKCSSRLCSFEICSCSMSFMRCAACALTCFRLSSKSWLEKLKCLLLKCFISISEWTLINGLIKF